MVGIVGTANQGNIDGLALGRIGGLAIVEHRQPGQSLTPQFGIRGHTGEIHILLHGILHAVQGMVGKAEGILHGHMAVVVPQGQVELEQLLALEPVQTALHEDLRQLMIQGEVQPQGAVAVSPFHADGLEHFAVFHHTDAAHRHAALQAVKTQHRMGPGVAGIVHDQRLHRRAEHFRTGGLQQKARHARLGVKAQLHIVIFQQQRLLRLGGHGGFLHRTHGVHLPAHGGNLRHKVQRLPAVGRGRCMGQLIGHSLAMAVKEGHGLLVGGHLQLHGRLGRKAVGIEHHILERALLKGNLDCAHECLLGAVDLLCAKGQGIAEILPSVVITLLQAAACQNIMELVEQHLLPCFGEALRVIGHTQQYPCGRGPLLRGEKPVLRVAVPLFHGIMTGIAAAGMVQQVAADHGQAALVHALEEGIRVGQAELHTVLTVQFGNAVQVFLGWAAAVVAHAVEAHHPVIIRHLMGHPFDGLG